MSSSNEEISSNDEMGSDEEMVPSNENNEMDSEELGSNIDMNSGEEFVSDDEENYSNDGSRYECSIIVEQLFGSLNYLLYKININCNQY